MKLIPAKTSTLIACAVAILLTSTSLAQRHASNDEGAGRDQWEYLVISGGSTNFASASTTMKKESSGSFSREWFPLEANMDKLGVKGWELITVVGNPGDPVFYFKRRK